MQQLISARADLEAANNAGETAMHLAGAGGKDPVAVALYKANAKVSVADNAGRIPAALAEEYGHTLLGESLVARGKEQEAAAATAGGASRGAQWV